MEKRLGCPLWNKGWLCSGAKITFVDDIPVLTCGMDDPEHTHEETLKYCEQNHMWKIYPELIAYLRQNINPL